MSTNASMKLWAGRFESELDAAVNDFNASIRVDSKMAEEDLTGSIAHAEMLGKTGILSEEDSALIVKTLSEIREEIREGKLKVDLSAEDIHTFCEAELTSRIGDVGKRLHTARSRNDQVAAGCGGFIFGNACMTCVSGCYPLPRSSQSAPRGSAKPLCPVIRISSGRSPLPSDTILWRIPPCSSGTSEGSTTV